MTKPDNSGRHGQSATEVQDGNGSKQTSLYNKNHQDELMEGIGEINKAKTSTRIRNKEEYHQPLENTIQMMQDCEQYTHKLSDKEDNHDSVEIIDPVNTNVGIEEDESFTQILKYKGEDETAAKAIQFQKGGNITHKVREEQDDEHPIQRIMENDEKKASILILRTDEGDHDSTMGEDVETQEIKIITKEMSLEKEKDDNAMGNIAPVDVNLKNEETKLIVSDVAMGKYIQVLGDKALEDAQSQMYNLAAQHDEKLLRIFRWLETPAIPVRSGSETVYIAQQLGALESGTLRAFCERVDFNPEKILQVPDNHFKALRYFGEFVGRGNYTLFSHQENYEWLIHARNYTLGHLLLANKFKLLALERLKKSLKNPPKADYYDKMLELIAVAYNWDEPRDFYFSEIKEQRNRIDLSPRNLMHPQHISAGLLQRMVLSFVMPHMEGLSELPGYREFMIKNPLFSWDVLRYTT